MSAVAVTEHEIDWAGERWRLLADGALVRTSDDTLLAGDLHLGKAASFRRQGLPVPAGTTADTLGRLTAAIARAGARRVVLLGDLLHDEHGADADRFAALARWRAAHATLEVVLVRGNHDRRAGDPPPGLRLRCVDEPWLAEGIACCHDPAAAPRRAPAIAAHVHPVVVARDPMGSALRLPAFVVGPRRVLLPAFGAFTGGAVVRPLAGERIFALGPDAIAEIPVVARAAMR